MAAKTVWETIKVEGGALLDQVKKIIEQGNARRLVIKQKGRSVAEFPLTVGVVGALLAPVLAAIATLVALLSECSIEIERAVPKPDSKGASKSNGGRRPRSGRN
jgi:hypothetical protein